MFKKIAVVMLVLFFIPLSSVSAENFWSGTVNNGNISSGVNFFADDGDIEDNIINNSAYGASTSVDNTSTDSSNLFGTWTINNGNVSATTDVTSDDYEVVDNEINTKAIGALTNIQNSSTGFDANEFFTDTLNTGNVSATTNYTTEEDEIDGNFGNTIAVGASTNITNVVNQGSMDYEDSHDYEDSYSSSWYEPSSNRKTVHLGRGQIGMEYENEGNDNWFRTDTHNTGNISATTNVNSYDDDIEYNGSYDQSLSTLAIGASTSIVNVNNSSSGSYYDSRSGFSTLTVNDGNVSAQTNLDISDYGDIHDNVISTVAIGANTSVSNTIGSN